MKNKLKIADLKVESFVTEIDNSGSNTQVMGGIGTNDRICAISVWLCVSENVCPSQVSACITNRC